MSDTYYDPMTGVPIGAPTDPNQDDRDRLQKFAMGAVAANDRYNPDVQVGMWPGYKAPKPFTEVPDTRVIGDGGQVSPGVPAVNRAADVMGGLASDYLIPKSPSDYALMAVGGPLGKGAQTAAAAFGFGLDSDPAEAAKLRLRKAKGGMGEVLSGADLPPPIGHNMPPPDVTGSLNPLKNEKVTFRGKDPSQFTPDDLHAYGLHYGVPNLGPLSPLETFKDAAGNAFDVPGGVGGKWTYADLLHMKANPINPANVDRALHAEMQRKLGRTMTPEELTDADVWNGLVFGMTSPNNPLLPNQLTASRLRLRTPEMLDDLASQIPWKAGDEVTPQARKVVNDAIAARYGLDAASKGGLGTRGTADYSRVAEMAQLFKQNPQFFRKRDEESWLQAVERISSQLPGLSMKTGSFGTVWQAPAYAAISAIDRHMARELDRVTNGGIFGPGEKVAWQNQSVGRWNKRENDRVAAETEANLELAKKGKAPKEITPANLAENFDDLTTKRGWDGFMGEMLLDHVGKALEPKYKLASGKINPNLPDHLKEVAGWVKDPQKVQMAGQAYKRALEVNQKLADESGLNLFMSQWMEWDRIRNRFEPHENMFPGLSKLPALSVDQMRAVDKAHMETGHKTYGKTDEGTLQPTRPLAGIASRMGYFGIGAPLVPGLLQREDGTR